MSFFTFTKANDLDIWLIFSYFSLLGIFVNNFNTFIATLSLEPCKNARKKEASWNSKLVPGL